MELRLYPQNLMRVMPPKGLGLTGIPAGQVPPGNNFNNYCLWDIKHLTSSTRINSNNKTNIITTII